MMVLGTAVAIAMRVLAIALPDWLERLDGANAVIGIVGLLFGLLGIAYLVLALIATPLPSTEPAEPSPYPTVDRFFVPLVLPVGVALLVALVIFLLSQILLVVPEAVATPIALGIAILVLFVCAVVAAAPRISRGLIYAVIGVPFLALVIAGGISGIYRHNESVKAAEARANAPQTSLTEVTTDNKFSKTSYNVPAGQAITLTQDNKGLAAHNWHVLDVKSTDGKDIMTPVQQPGQSTAVTFTIDQPGTYKFQCDVHPTEMIGTLNVVASGSSTSS